MEQAVAKEAESRPAPFAGQVVMKGGDAAEFLTAGGNMVAASMTAILNSIAPANILEQRKQAMGRGKLRPSRKCRRRLNSKWRKSNGLQRGIHKIHG